MPTPQIPPIALVLAAGFARRFGADKRSARLADGRTVLDTVLARIADANIAALPVLRIGDEALLPHYPLALPVADAIALQGMGSSLAAAAALVPAGRDVMVCLADMPFVQASTYATLARAAARDHIVCPIHQKRRGNPVLFGADFIDELKKLSGDRGARALLERFADCVIDVAVDDPGIHRDIDILTDLS